MRFWNRQYIYHVTDGAQWSFDWVAHYINEGLKKIKGVRPRITSDPWRLKGQIIHFGDRYAYLNGNYKTIDPSNRVFMTWFHGDPNDPNPDMQQIFERLPAALPYLEKIVVSCGITREALVNYGIPAEKLVTIPIGVDLERFSPVSPEQKARIRHELGIPPDAICVGSFQKDGRGWGDGEEPKLIKGPDIFLQVMEQLALRYPHLLVLLTGPARAYVKNGLDKLGVRYIHHFLQDYHQIGRYYQALDMYLITSRAEGGPQGLMEGWASGVPVISTRMGMPADLIRHGENGLLAEVEDVQGLTAQAVHLIENPNLREQFRQRGLVDVQELGWDHIARQYYEKLYRLDK